MLINSRSNSKIEKGRGEGKMHIVDPLNEIPEVGGGKSPHKKEAAAGENKPKPKKVDQAAAAQKADAPAAKVEEQKKPAQQKVG